MTAAEFTIALQVTLVIGAFFGLAMANDGNRGAAIVSAACIIGAVALEIAKMWSGS